MKTLTNWALATLLAAVLCLGTALGGPDDIEVMQATAEAVTALPVQAQAMQVTP
jgi:hypothetical protein